MTLSEKILWQFLRGSCFAGLRFRRQHPVGRYVVDFYCSQKKLIIELDGEYHDHIQHEDKDREDFFVKQGFRVLRFTNEHFIDHMELTLQAIACTLAIDWQKSYYDCVRDVKCPKKLHALLRGVKKFREAERMEG
jgi:very-short-patch-repair endonuclease